MLLITVYLTDTEFEAASLHKEQEIKVPTAASNSVLALLLYINLH